MQALRGYRLGVRLRSATERQIEDVSRSPAPAFVSSPYEASVTEPCVQMATLLRELRSRADGDEYARIGDILNAVRTKG
jgi:hypothetical protein